MKAKRVAPVLLTFSFACSAGVLTLGQSTQSVTMTGLGANASGAGTSRLTWGSCTYDGTNTTCVVSGPYTTTNSTGNGTYAFTLQYPGNGISPLTAIASPAGSDNVIFNLTAGSLTFAITQASGPKVQFLDLNFNFQYSQLNDNCTVVTTCSVGAVGVSTGATITGPVTGTFDPTPKITTPNGLISASSYGGFAAIAPATWIEIYGTNLATVVSQTWAGSDFNGVNAPTALGGTTVTVAGKPAYVDFVSAHQVNVQVPSGIPTGSQPVVVTTAGGASTQYFVTVNTTEPGILAPAAFHIAAGQYAVALASNGTTYILPAGTTNAVPTALAHPGDTIILYGVGFGTVTPAIDAGAIVQQANQLATNFTATIGGQPATVQFAGLVSGFLGLYQFNIVVPQVPANNATPFTFTLGGTTGTQQLLLAIGN